MGDRFIATKRASTNLFDKDNPDIHGWYIGASSNGVYDGNKCVVLPVKNNTIYTARNIDSTVGIRYCLFEQYPTNDTINTYVLRDNQTSNSKNFNTSTANYVIIQIMGDYKTTSVDLTCLMVNEGSTALPYESYGDKLQNRLIETKESSLPSGYTELEYIQSSGTQYINTGIAVSDSNEIELKAEYSNLASANLYGCSNSGWATNTAVYHYQFNTLRFLKSAGMFNYTSTGLHTFKVNSSSVTIDGVSAAWNTDSGNSSTGNLIIFAGYRDTALMYGSYKLYSFKVTKGTVLRNFIPARRKSDSVVGMFDTVTQTFFENKGTGVFTAGTEVFTIKKRIICTKED